MSLIAIKDGNRKHLLTLKVLGIFFFTCIRINFIFKFPNPKKNVLCFMNEYEEKPLNL